MMDKDTQVKIERDLLDAKIQELEAKINGAQKALFETDLKIHTVMIRLLTANDVNKDQRGWKAMREQILEQMNDLQRNVKGFFKNEGIEPNASNDEWRQSDSVDRRAEAPVQFSRFDTRVRTGTFQ